MEPIAPVEPTKITPKNPVVPTQTGATTATAASGAALRKKLTFVPVQEEKKPEEPKPAPKKLKFNVFDADEEDKKEEAAKPAPPKKINMKDNVNFLANMLSKQGPPPSFSAARPVSQSTVAAPSQTPEEIIDAKLSVPKLTAQRRKTTRYDASKHDFDGF